ncbi:lytic transglycosylase domain-containing protein [Abyssalbus ytuae]|uniref:Lytic transglycosylase domain-containing protein n=1 Tax=Abyssalbus ytuae TaxID=2926907 RepID=A0A9E7CU06_9FLAO|nr:lytic transglycosylase domain-containing protein [Abyssalbus ytuae]UOB17292.1 lytic transglycosylase domain-containing protein [Abyssalbus ytuae]
MRKSKLKVPFLVAVILFTNYGFTYKTVTIHENYQVKEPLNYMVNTDEGADVIIPPFLGKAFNGFREAIAFKESRGDYSIINRFGYMGKYQFGAATLKMVGVYNTNTFISNPELQEEVFIANLKRNKWILRKDIKRFVGKSIRGVKVTESGILAAAHLGGAGNVKKYLRSYGSYNFEDAYGTSIRYYMKKFGGYDVSNVEQERKAKAIIKKAKNL